MHVHIIGFCLWGSLMSNGTGPGTWTEKKAPKMLIYGSYYADFLCSNIGINDSWAHIVEYKIMAQNIMVFHQIFFLSFRYMII